MTALMRGPLLLILVFSGFHCIETGESADSLVHVLKTWERVRRSKLTLSDITAND